MKKVLFLLLVTSISYGQALFDKGVKITGGITTDNSATKVVVQSANNVLNTISKVDLIDAIIVNTTAELTSGIGNINKLYATRDNNIIYRYNGTIYVPLSADISGKEDIANKQNSLAVDATNLKYPTVTSVNAGLATKQNTISGTTNVIPKFGSGGLVESNIFDNGTNVGIGTITPDTKLDVRINNSLNAPSAYFINNDGNAGTIALIGQDTFSKNGFFGYYGSGSGSYRGLNPNTAYFGAGGGASQLSLNTNGATPITFHTGDWFERMRVSSGGNVLINTTTDNGVDKLQVNGTISASPATLSNQVVVKSQLDLKANIADPTFTTKITTPTVTLTTVPTDSDLTANFLTRNITTGVIERRLVSTVALIASPNLTGTPTAPTATAGTNTTQIATTAFVLANSNANGLLEFNTGDRTVWNNGKSDVTDNTSFGQFALRAKTTGGGNSAFGDGALRSNTTGTENTAIGLSSLSSNLIGTGNTTIGSNSLSAQTVGSNNTVVGNYTGSGITNISNSVLIGYQATPFGNTETNEIVIGHNTTGAGSNTATLGNTLITSTILRGTVTAGNATASNHLVTMSQVAQQLKDFFADVNNTGTTETDLFSYTTLSNRLNITGEKLVANYGGSFNDATASSQIKVLFGGQVIGDTGALTMSVTGAWVTTVSIIRTGSTTARAIVNITTPSASTAAYTKYTSLTGVDFTTTNILKITGTAAGATGGSSDITATYGNIIWQPAAL